MTSSATLKFDIIEWKIYFLFIFKEHGDINFTQKYDEKKYTKKILNIDLTLHITHIHISYS